MITPVNGAFCSNSWSIFSISPPLNRSKCSKIWSNFLQRLEYLLHFCSIFYHGLGYLLQLLEYLLHLLEYLLQLLEYLLHKPEYFLQQMEHLLQQVEHFAPFLLQISSIDVEMLHLMWSKILHTLEHIFSILTCSISPNAPFFLEHYWSIIVRLTSPAWSIWPPATRIFRFGRRRRAVGLPSFVLLHRAYRLAPLRARR